MLDDLLVDVCSSQDVRATAHIQASGLLRAGGAEAMKPWAMQSPRVSPLPCPTLVCGSERSAQIWLTRLSHRASIACTPRTSDLRGGRTHPLAPVSAHSARVYSAQRSETARSKGAP